MGLEVLELIEGMCYKRMALLSEVLFVKGFSESLYDFFGLERLLLTLLAQIE